MSDIDFDKVFEMRDTLPASEAKIAIQAYAKSIGIKIPKTGIGVKGMVDLLMDKADNEANSSFEPAPNSPPPDVAINRVVVTAPLGDFESFEPAIAEGVDLETLPSVTYVVRDETPGGILAHASDARMMVINEPLAVVGFTAEQEERIQAAISKIRAEEAAGFILPDRYEPRNELIGRAPDAYLNLPYWILDWINKAGWDWKRKVGEYEDKQEISYLYDLLYYIRLTGKVIVRETRNSHFHHLR